MDETFTPGQIVWAIAWRKLRYICAAADGRHMVEPAFRVDDEEYFAGPVCVDTVFSAPPTEGSAKVLERLKTEIEESKKAFLDWKNQVQEVQSKVKFWLQRCEQFDDMVDLETHPEDKITHFVVQTDKAILVRNTEDRAWTLGEYSSARQILPCVSLDDAISKIKILLIVRLEQYITQDTLSGVENTIAAAHKYLVPIPERLIARLDQEQESKLRFAVQENYSKLQAAYKALDEYNKGK